MRVSLRLFRVRPIFYITSDKLNVSLVTGDCSLHTGRIALKDDCCKQKNQYACIYSVECDYLESLAKTFIISA